MILRQRVIPVVILFGLLPRSYYYLLRVEKYPLSVVWFMFFVCISAIYIIYRFILIYKTERTRKRLVMTILDTLIIIIGICTACYFVGGNNKSNYFLLCCTAIPFYVNNYLVSNFLHMADREVS